MAILGNIFANRIAANPLVEQFTNLSNKFNSPQGKLELEVEFIQLCGKIGISRTAAQIVSNEYIHNMTEQQTIDSTGLDQDSVRSISQGACNKLLPYFTDFKSKLGL